MFTRIREIIDPFGRRLRLSVEPHPAGALVTVDRPDVAGEPRVLLSGYGAEVLSGYIMAARLAVPSQLPDETIGGRFAATLRLSSEPAAAIELRQEEAALEVPAPFWDKLYAELCLVGAHARELDRRQRERVH